MGVGGLTYSFDQATFQRGFFLLWLSSNVTLAGEPTGGTRPRPRVAALAIGLAALGLVIAVVLPVLVPVFRFAHPNGPYGIGTLTYHWVDASRSDVFAADPKERRQLMAQIWYPAKADPAAPRAAYMAQADAVMAAFARIHGKPAFLFGHFKYVTTNAMPSGRQSDAGAVSCDRAPELYAGRDGVFAQGHAAAKRSGAG